jgi:hypothetical protein
MSYAADVLTSTLVHLLPKFEEMFLESHPVLDLIVKGSQIERQQAKGPTLAFTLLKGGVGATTGIRTGNEQVLSTRRNQGVRGEVEGYRAIYHFNVPNKDLAEVSGPHDFARIVDDYPKVGLAEHMEQFADQFARGASSSGNIATGMDGFCTLNGQQTYNPQGTARQGVFQFSTTQNNTVFGVAMEDAASGTTGWKHQYADIDNFSTQGLTVLRKLVTRANQQGAQLEGGGINVMLADEGTFHNYINALEDRVYVENKIDNAAAKYANREGVKFGNATMWWEPSINVADTSSFSGVALDGVLYGLNTAYWGLFILGNNADKASKGFFDLQDPFQVPNGDAYQYRIVSYFNPYCRSLRHQLAMTGGAIE